MDIIVKFLFYSGRYIIVVTTQSIIEALKRTSQIKTKIMDGIDKSFDVIGSHENMLQLFNENLETIGGNSGIELAFISDRHKVEFEKYLKNLEKSVHSMEMNGKLNNISNEELIFPNQNQMTSNIINRYTIKNVSVQGIFASSSIMNLSKAESIHSNEKDEHIISKDSTQEIFNSDDDASWNNINIYANSDVASSDPLSSKIQTVDEEVISIKDGDNELTEQLPSNRLNSSETSAELQQDGPIMSQLFDYDTKALASVIVMNNEKKINYFVKNSVGDFCKDLELNLHGLRNKKARNLLTTSNSKTLIKKLINNQKDATISHNILNNLITRKSEDNEIKCNRSSDAHTLKEETRNDDRNSSFQIDFENTGKLFHQNMESFRMFERRLHDIRIKRQLDEIRNDRIREIHNIKGGDEFSASNEKWLKEKAIKEVFKDLSHNLDITMKKLASNETRFKAIEKKLKQLELMSISSEKSNVSDLLSEISVNREEDKGIELLTDDVKKIELEIMADESNQKLSMDKSNTEPCQLFNGKSSNTHSKKSEIPILKSEKKETTPSTKQILPEMKISQDNKVEGTRNKFGRKLNKEISTSKKTYFHNFKEIGSFAKSKPNESMKNYKNDILKMPFKNYPTSLPNEQVDKIIVANYRQNKKTPNSKTTSNLIPKNELLEKIILNRENSAKAKKAKFKETTDALTTESLKAMHASTSRVQALGPKMHFSNTSNRGEDKMELNFDGQIHKHSNGRSKLETNCAEHMDKCNNSNSESIMESYRLYAHALDNEPIDFTFQYSKDATSQTQDTDPWDVDVKSSDKNKNTQLQLNNDNFDRSIAEHVKELDDGYSILSIDKINQIEEACDIQKVIQQLSYKLDNSHNGNTAVNVTENDETVSSKSIQRNDKAYIESTKTVEEVLKKSLKVENLTSKDSSVDYINAVNNAFQNNPQIYAMDEEYLQNDYNSTEKSKDTKSKQKVKSNPIFSTIDSNIYNEVESEGILEYKDAIMTNNISIKKPPNVHSEKLIINDFGEYEIKKTMEHIKNSDAKKIKNKDGSADYEMKKAREHLLNLENIDQRREPGNYEVQKLQEHLINVDKTKSFEFIPIEEILKSELMQCCIGSSAQSRDVLFDIHRGHKYLKNCSIRDNKCDDFRTFDYEAFKAFEHFRSVDASRLSPACDCTFSKENMQLKISPTLCWDSEGSIKDCVKNESVNIGEQNAEVEKLNTLLGLPDCGVKNNENNPSIGLSNECSKPSISDSKNITPEKLNCITKENENALEAILQNINNVINDKSVAENTITATGMESAKANNVINNSSKTCIGLEGPEQKYKKMCDLLNSIKNTIQIHKVRVEQTIKNYEDLFQRNTVDVMIQKHGDYRDTTLCYELVNHLNNRRANINRNGNGIEEFEKKISNIYDAQTTTSLINREKFKRIVADFMNAQKNNEEFLQCFDRTIENIERKPKSNDCIQNKLNRAQYKSFLGEYSKQISQLNQEISEIPDANIKRNEIVNKDDDKTNVCNTLMQPPGDISNIRNSSDISKKLINATEVEKGVFEDQISKLSIETEKNQSCANRNIPRTSTKISMPMLQKENMEIDKMIEVNKKAFAELESTLKVVKLIGPNTSVPSTSQNIFDEQSTCAITKSDDEDCTVKYFRDIHETVTFSSSDNNNLNSLMSLKKYGQTKIDLNDSVQDNKYIENQRNMILNEKLLDKIKTKLGEQIEEYNVDIESKNNVQMETKKDGIKALRKGSDREFHRDKHGTQSSLKHHEVKKKEYHTRCTNTSKDSKKEDKNDNVIPTALIVTHNTEIPIQMMPMIEDSIFLNNFNIQKSLINFEVPRKELITVGVDDSCKENYLKESITENVLFKNLINLEEVKKFFRFNEEQNPSGGKDKNNIKKNDKNKFEETACGKSKLATDELKMDSINMNVKMKKENDIKLKKHFITKNRINMESINKIKEQCLRKKHIESKPIDTRTQKEIERSISLYKEKSRKKHEFKAEKYGAAMDNSQYIISKLKNLISGTNFFNAAADSKIDATTNDKKTNFEPELSEQVPKINLLSIQNVPEHTVEAAIDTVGLKMTDQKEQSITLAEGEKAAMCIEKLLQTSENSIESKNDYNSRTDNATKDNNIENQEENKKILELGSKPYFSISDFQPKLEERNSYELKESKYNDTNFQGGTDRIKSDVTYANSFKQNQNKYKVSQFQEEYIYAEQSKNDRNRGKIEDVIERNEKNLGYEERGQFEVHNLYSQHLKPKLYPNGKSNAEQRNVKREVEYINRKHIERSENVTGKKEQNNITTVNEQMEHGVEKKVQKHSIDINKFRIGQSHVLQKNSKQEQFIGINGDNTQQFPHLSVTQNRKNNKGAALKSSEAKSEIIVIGNKKISKADYLTDLKQKNTMQLKNHLKLLAEVNMNSAKTQRKFENIYQQIEKLDTNHLKRPKHFKLRAWAPVKTNEKMEKRNEEEAEEGIGSSEKDNNVPLSESVNNGYPKNMELLNQIHTMPQKTMWNPHYAGKKKMWKRLQHLKKLASEKNAEKFYVLGTKLPTLRMNTVQAATPRVSERLLPHKKPKQYQYQVKKVKVGERLMNITYLVEVKDSKFQ